MTVSRSLSPFLAALAASISLSASAGAYPPNRTQAALHHRVEGLRAESPAPFFFLPTAEPRSASRHETDGLSRNPADCVKYGCIDSGG